MHAAAIPTILIVDDDANLLAGLTRVLYQEPYRILSRTSAEDALLLLGMESIDVLVTDEQMPGMSGTDLVMATRVQYPAVVSIMLSGEASMGALIRALNQGEIYRFLIKPCSHDDLATSIRQALRYKLMIDHCRDLLPLYRHQSAILSSIESRLPGFIDVVDQELPTRALTRRITRTEGNAVANRLDVVLSDTMRKRA